MKKPNKNILISPELARAADQTRKSCIAELKYFRGNAHRALVSFQLKVEGEIEQVIELFANKKTGVTDEEIINGKRTVDEIVAALKRLKLKSRKARKKDIKKIEEIIAILHDKTDTIT
jgi:hypothetical protein